MLTINPDLINSCRVCRSPNQDGDYQCLFENANEHEVVNRGLSESGVLYEKLLDISLNERNYYPQFLCNSCLLQMKLFVKLKDKALKALEYFQSIYDESVAHATEPIENESSNFNYESNEQIILSKERQDSQDLLYEYQIKPYEVYQENEANDYPEAIVEELDKTVTDETNFENTNYSYPVHVQNNTYSEHNIEQDRLFTEQQIIDSVISNIETNFKGDRKVETNVSVNKFSIKDEPDEKIIQNANCEEQFPITKLEPILDKNDYVTEIYELIDDECDIEEMYLESQENAEDADFNSISEANTDISSPYNDIEYLLDEETEDLEDKANLLEIKNAFKRRRLNKEFKRNRTYKCLSCQLEFKDSQTYKLHRIESHNENFNCDACAKEFKTISALQKHTKLVHNDEPAYQCEICQKTFNQKVHFQYHMNYHNNIRNYKCDICEKAFIAKADLKTHLRLHTGVRPYVCNVCGKDYIMMEHLKAHFITHTEQSFPCEVCHKQFTTHKTLRLHVRTIHEDEPRFKCNFCLKPFRRKHHLEYHMKSHEKNVKYLETSVEINKELDSVEDIVEEAVDDPGFIYLM